MTKLAIRGAALALVLVLCAGFVSPVDAGNRYKNRPSIAATASDSDDLSILVDALICTELVGLFGDENDGPWTVFAPTNDAFIALLDELSAGSETPVTLDDLCGPLQDTLVATLLNHVVKGKLRAPYLRGQAFAGERVETLGGLTLGVQAHPLRVNLIDAIDAIPASNGQIFVIDEVLTDEPSIADTAVDAGLNTLVGAVVSTGLLETLDEGGPFTVFAPTEQAFADLGIDLSTLSEEDLRGILLDHVVVGEYDRREIFQLFLSRGSLQAEGGLELRFFGNRVNGLRIVGSNISAGNGIIHLIDGVLLED